ncbi:MAG: LON peptidase substrate-binding domain-containing protein, partial [Vicinamibacterales bacterium]
MLGELGVTRSLAALLLGLVLLLPGSASAQLTPLSVPELPTTIPLFPLPNVAVLPYLQLPLHIFEPRYREMLTDAMASDHVVGLVQLQPGFEADYEGRPPIFSIG